MTEGRLSGERLPYEALRYSSRSGSYHKALELRSALQRLLARSNSPDAEMRVRVHFLLGRVKRQFANEEGELEEFERLSTCFLEDGDFDNLAISTFHEAISWHNLNQTDKAMGLLKQVAYHADKNNLPGLLERCHQTLDEWDE